MGNETEIMTVAKALARLQTMMPKSVATRMESALSYFDKADNLLATDREMASFRAICGEEEAASAVILALQHRKYDGASRLNPRNHIHKWAVGACMMALADPLRPFLTEFQLGFDFTRGRITAKIPLKNFGVAGGEAYAIEPVEPLDLLHSKSDSDGDYAFEDELANLAKRSSFENIKELVAGMANARNRLLYASDTELPKSSADAEALLGRRYRGIAMLVIAVMILQSNRKLATVRQAVPALLSIVTRLPKQIEA